VIFGLRCDPGGWRYTHRGDNGRGGGSGNRAQRAGPRLERLKQSPMKQLVAATSVGIVDGTPLLDLCYEEDSQAEVDMNVVMTADGGLVEAQATAEKGSFSRRELNELVDLAEAGIKGDFRRSAGSAGGLRQVPLPVFRSQGFLMPAMPHLVESAQSLCAGQGMGACKLQDFSSQEQSAAQCCSLHRFA